MFDDDNSARRAFRTLGDEPAPPVVTTLDQVVRRGKRRVFVQRASAVAGVVAVVAGIGIGTILLRPDDQAGGVRVGDTTITTAPPAPPSSTSALPGWERVGRPSADGRKNCTTSGLPAVPDVDVPTLSADLVDAAVTAAVRTAIPIVNDEVILRPGAGTGGSTYLFVTAEVIMDNGIGQIQLELGRYGGSPLAAADASVGAYGGCQAPYRRVLADGTVLQLYEVNDYNPEHPVQPLRVYQPGGRMFTITAAGYSNADLVQGKNTTAYTVKGGRGKLPIPEAKLATVAELLASTMR
jgi:hypothetical protein